MPIKVSTHHNSINDTKKVVYKTKTIIKNLTHKVNKMTTLQKATLILEELDQKEKLSLQESLLPNELLNKEYSRLFKEIAEKFLTYTVNIDDAVLLDNLRNDVDRLIPGDYDPKTGNIRVVSEAVNDMELGLAGIIGVDTKAVKELYRLVEAMPAIEEQTGFVEMATVQPEYKKLVNETMIARLDEIASVLVHELTHVAAVKFMAKTPDNKCEKAIQDRVRMLFEDAKTRYAAMGNDVEDTTKAYWAKNINEFLAEALSNPETIKLLESMKTGKMGRLSTVLRVLLDTLAALVGTKKNKDNVYYYTLDSILAMVENKGKSKGDNYM